MEEEIENDVNKIIEELSIMQDTDFSKLSHDELSLIIEDLNDKKTKVDDILTDLYRRGANPIDDALKINLLENTLDDINDLLSNMPSIPQEKVEEMNIETKELEENVEEINIEAEEPKENVEEINIEAEEPKEDVEEINIEAEEPKEDVEEINIEAEEPEEDVEEINIEAEESEEDVEEINIEAEEPEEDVEEINIETEEPVEEEEEKFNIFTNPNFKTMEEALKIVDSRRKIKDLDDVEMNCRMAKQKLIEKIISPTAKEIAKKIEKEIKTLEERSR